jgi:hypothetical protein
MKNLAKIAVFVGLVAFMSSCQKEELPTTRGGCSSHQDNSASNQRGTDPETNPTSIGSKPVSLGGPATTISGDEGVPAEEIVGGGDDDRNGGGDGKKEKKR